MRRGIGGERGQLSVVHDFGDLVFQLAALQKLEIENFQAARKLEEVVEKGELLLQQVQTALSDIAQTQLKMQALENQQDGTT